MFPRKKKSFIWNHFDMKETQQINIVKVICCKYCSYEKTYTGTTSIFTKHYMRNHGHLVNKPPASNSVDHVNPTLPASCKNVSFRERCQPANVQNTQLIDKTSTCSSTSSTKSVSSQRANSQIDDEILIGVQDSLKVLKEQMQTLQNKINSIVATMIPNDKNFSQEMADKARRLLHVDLEVELIYDDKPLLMVPFNPNNPNLFGTKLLSLLFTQEELATHVLEPKKPNSKKRPQLDTSRVNLLKAAYIQKLNSVESFMKLWPKILPSLKQKMIDQRRKLKKKIAIDGGCDLSDETLRNLLDDDFDENEIEDDENDYDSDMITQSYLEETTEEDDEIEESRTNCSVSKRYCSSSRSDQIFSKFAKSHV